MCIAYTTKTNSNIALKKMLLSSIRITYFLLKAQTRQPVSYFGRPVTGDFHGATDPHADGFRELQGSLQFLLKGFDVTGNFLDARRNLGAVFAVVIEQ